jgi:hypothetical protein
MKENPPAEKTVTKKKPSPEKKLRNEVMATLTGPKQFGTRGFPRLDVNNLSAAEKTKYVNFINQNPDRKKQFLRDTGIFEATFNKWSRIIRNGGTLHDKGGRPPAIDEDLYPDLQQLITARAERNDAMHNEEVFGQMRKMAEQTRLRRGQVPTKAICSKTIDTHCAKANLSEKTSECITNARYQAELDAYNGISTIIMWHAMMQRIKSLDSIINYDATTFVFHQCSRSKRVMLWDDVKVRENRAIKHTEEKSVGLGFGIKHMCVVAANGLTNVNYVFVVACDALPKEKCCAYQVKRLGRTIEDYGWLVFAHTRSGNKAFFDWFTRHILISFIARIKASRVMDEDAPFFVSCDGEKIQIDVYFNDDVLQKLEEHNTIVCKLPASTTAVSQACDAGNIFKASKTLLAHIDKARPNDDQLLAAVDQVIKEFCNAEDIKITSDHKNKIRYGLLYCRHVLSLGASEVNVRKSFEIIGVDSRGTLNVGQMLKQYSMNLTYDQYIDLDSKIPELCDLFWKNGELTDADMEGLVYIDSVGPMCKKPKDELKPLNQHRAVILNHSVITKRERLAVEMKEAEAQKKKRKPRAPKTPKADNKSGSDQSTKKIRTARSAKPPDWHEDFDVGEEKLEDA